MKKSVLSVDVMTLLRYIQHFIGSDGDVREYERRAPLIKQALALMFKDIYRNCEF